MVRRTEDDVQQQEVLPVVEQDVSNDVSTDEEGNKVEREAGSVVDVEALPFEVRKDGSIAYFTQEKAELQREVGS